MEERIKQIIGSVNIDVIKYNGNDLFEDGIIDSLELMEIIEAIEDELNIEFNAEDIIQENFKTVEAILNLVNKIVKKHG